MFSSSLYSSLSVRNFYAAECNCTLFSSAVIIRLEVRPSISFMIENLSSSSLLYSIKQVKVSWSISYQGRATWNPLEFLSILSYFSYVIAYDRSSVSLIFLRFESMSLSWFLSILFSATSLNLRSLGSWVTPDLKVRPVSIVIFDLLDIVLIGRETTDCLSSFEDKYLDLSCPSY